MCKERNILRGWHCTKNAHSTHRPLEMESYQLPPPTELSATQTLTEEEEKQQRDRKQGTGHGCDQTYILTSEACTMKRPYKCFLYPNILITRTTMLGNQVSLNCFQTCTELWIICRYSQSLPATVCSVELFKPCQNNVKKSDKLPFWAEVKSLSSHIPHVDTELSIWGETND